MPLRFQDTFWEESNELETLEGEEPDTHFGESVFDIMVELQHRGLLPQSSIDAWDKLSRMTGITRKRLVSLLYLNEEEPARPNPASDQEFEAFHNALTYLLGEEIPGWREILRQATELDRYEASLPDEELAALRDRERQVHLLKLAEGDTTRVQAAEDFFEAYLREHPVNVGDDEWCEVIEKYYRILKGES